MIGVAAKNAQTPLESGAAAAGEIIKAVETPIANAVVDEAAKAVMRQNVELSNEKSSLDYLCGADD